MEGVLVRKKSNFRVVIYVAVSLGERASILAQLKQIVPQFTYTGCDQPGSVVGGCANCMKFRR
jgi:hypothetical protein